MQLIVGHGPDHLVSRCYLYRYQSLVDSLQLDVESAQELDFEGTSTPMSLNGPHFELVYFIDIDYESQIGSKFAFVHKGILVTMQGCTRISEHGLQIGLID